MDVYDQMPKEIGDAQRAANKAWLEADKQKHIERQIRILRAAAYIKESK